jgi:hypothetical protein
MDQLLKADGQTRDAAVDQVLDLLGRFDGPPVEAARSHAGLARSRDLEEEELIDELTGLLHVSRHSDAFGFDLIGWLPPSPGSEPQVMCLEIKSSGDEGFHLSSGEWTRAQSEGNSMRCWSFVDVGKVAYRRVWIYSSILSPSCNLAKSGRKLTPIVSHIEHRDREPARIRSGDSRHACNNGAGSVETVPSKVAPRPHRRISAICGHQFAERRLQLKYHLAQWLLEVAI